MSTKNDAARPLAVITDNRFGDIEIEKALLQAAGVELREARGDDPSALAKSWKAADALLLNMARMDATAIDELERCAVIARYGIGLDNVDLAAAKRRGIAVYNVPGYCDTEVGEQTLALLLACARNLVQRDAAVRAGGWNYRRDNRRLAGTRLGILGFGGTGKALTRAVLGLGFSEILIWSPHISQARIDELTGPAMPRSAIVRPAAFDEVFELSDWVSVHLPLKPETRGIVGAREIGLMKKDAVLVNVSRGALVDEKALVDALAAGRLGGAGLDVFAVEPLPMDSGLRDLPGVVLSDHSAYASRESVRELRRRTAENALAGLRAAGLAR